MAVTRLDAIRLGPTTITGGGAAQTLGQVACSTLVGTMANNTQLYVDVVVALFDNAAAGAGGGTVYASLLTLTAPLMLTAGPTYTLGTVSTSTLSQVGGGPTHAAATLDISGGNLRVRITPNGDDLSGYAVVSTLAPP
jgi:hypothetical protein